MKDFSTIPNTKEGGFPNTQAKNETTVGAKDGTPYTDQVVNEVWGAFQAMLSKAGMTPSGNVETYDASQFLDSVHRTAGHPGEVVYWAGHLDGNGVAVTEEGGSVNLNLIELRGQYIDTLDAGVLENYGKLIDATYVGDANNSNSGLAGFYKFDTSTIGGGGEQDPEDDVRDTSGTGFRLPDCRGHFIRCADTSGDVALKRDLDRTNQGLGGYTSFQAEGYLYHEHAVMRVSSISEQIADGDGWTMQTSSGSVSGSDDALVYTGLNTTDYGYVTDRGANNDSTIYNSTQRACAMYRGDEEPSDDVDIETADLRPNNLNFKAMIRF